MESLKPTPDNVPVGLNWYYPHPRQAVFQAAQEVVQDLGLRIVETDPVEMYILAKRGVTFRSWGDMVGVYVLNSTDTITPVVIVSQPVFPANIAARDYAKDLRAGLNQKLAARDTATPSSQ